MAHGIFISYRRKDTESVASRLADDLRAQLVGVQIFRDVETIAPGEDFVVSLERALADCAVMLVLISPLWNDIRDDQGRRRLEDPNDWTRLEIATALARQVRVIPILSGGAQLPSSQNLPENIQALTRRQTTQIDNNRWHYDVDQLIDALVRAENFKRAKPTTPPSMWRKLGLIGGCVFLGMVLFAAYGDKGTTPPAVEPAPIVKQTQSEAEAPPAVAPKTIKTPLSKPHVAKVEVQADEPVRPAPIITPSTVPDNFPNLSGWWRTNTAIRYFFQQNGADIAVQVGLNGQQTGSGHGHLQGNGLQLSVTISPNGTPQTANCLIFAAQNWTMFSGNCMSPTGAFPLQIFR